VHFARRDFTFLTPAVPQTESAGTDASTSMPTTSDPWPG